MMYGRSLVEGFVATMRMQYQPLQKNCVVVVPVSLIDAYLLIGHPYYGVDDHGATMERSTSIPGGGDDHGATMECSTSIPAGADDHDATMGCSTVILIVEEWDGVSLECLTRSLIVEEWDGVSLECLTSNLIGWGQHDEYLEYCPIVPILLVPNVLNCYWSMY
jgi:hypothetical protein